MSINGVPGARHRLILSEAGATGSRMFFRWCWELSDIILMCEALPPTCKLEAGPNICGVSVTKTVDFGGPNQSGISEGTTPNGLAREGNLISCIWWYGDIGFSHTLDAETGRRISDWPRPIYVFIGGWGE